ncbi:replication protein [Brevibacillus centrosporus]|uniref:replication protein n=1 Tax=Brevibacillus centrosporus TaxID=54910 RepID=UPI000F09C1BF|nr:replication protein [Brevibacillus centrosporus]MEC2131641.1 replication protein [Brevibacillus centrosporus]RNB63277.1 hypothetical protein EDM55_29275 [Brevibacillus centrosporus]GED35054.1 hypothetical protein BCE02nite_61950 [Brevibacillus centrosporus]
MTTPQIEDGYTRLANEILTHIMKASLNGTQFRIVMAVWRFTYGFQRKEHELSIGFIAQAIDASRGQVDRELSALIERNIITVVATGLRGSRVIRFNKNHSEWVEPQQPLEAPKGKGKKKPSPEPKKNPVRKPKQYEEDNTYFKMAVYFHDKVSAVAAAEGLTHLVIKADLQKWADEFRKIVEIDKVDDKHLIRDVIEWVTTDSFWKTNVLSAKTLRNKFGELALKMKVSAKPKQQQKPKADSRDKELAFQEWVSNGNDPDEFDWS